MRAPRCLRLGARLAAAKVNLIFTPVVLRVETGDLRLPCSNGRVSLTNYGIAMCYTSNEGHYFTI